MLKHGASVVLAERFLDDQTHSGTEYLARRIVARVDAGAPVEEPVDLLLSRQNPDGGFGEFAGYESSALDTGFALEALAKLDQSMSEAGRLAAGFLMRRQRPDGGWSDAEGDSSVYVTAQAARSLAAYQGRLPGVAEAVAQASNFLLSRRGTDSGWVEDFLSAQALLTLASVATDLSPIRQSAEALRARRLADGSWAEDVYTTAVALRALQVYDSRAGGTPFGDRGSVSGYVRKAGSDEPLADAMVSWAIDGSVSIRTNGDGHFVLSGVPAGAQTLIAQKSGFAPVAKIATVPAGGAVEIGVFHLAQDEQTGLLSGEVFDGTTRLPLAGVEISLAGPASFTAVSRNDGTFDIGGLPEGSYTIALVRDGYNGVSGPIRIAAGVATRLRQELVEIGVYLDDGPATLRGRVVDAATGLPLPEARVVLNGEGEAVTDSGGGFAFQAVARGDYGLNVGANGYATRAFSFMFAPGATGDLGDLAIYRETAAAAPHALTLFGRLIDGVNGHPVGAASVNLEQIGESRRSDAEGRFVFEDIEVLAFDLAVAADGFESARFHVAASGFGEIALTLPLPPAGGDETASSTTMRGTVKDAATGEGVAGAIVSVSGTTLQATTDGTGTFDLSGIRPPGIHPDGIRTRLSGAGFPGQAGTPRHLPHRPDAGRGSFG